MDGSCTGVGWHTILCPWNFPGRNTRVDCYFLLWGIFSIQGSNSHLFHLPVSVPKQLAPVSTPGKVGSKKPRTRDITPPLPVGICEHQKCVSPLPLETWRGLSPHWYPEPRGLKTPDNCQTSTLFQANTANREADESIGWLIMLLTMLLGC